MRRPAISVVSFFLSQCTRQSEMGCYIDIDTKDDRNSLSQLGYVIMGAERSHIKLEPQGT